MAAVSHTIDGKDSTVGCRKRAFEQCRALPAEVSSRAHEGRQQRCQGPGALLHACHNLPSLLGRCF